MSDFWDDISFGNMLLASESAVDEIIEPRIHKKATHSVRELTDAYRNSISLKLPVEAGTRVSFITNLGSVLTYKDMPEPYTEGTVVTVRTASGDTTSLEGLVFVNWDRGGMIPIRAEHLSREATAPRAKKAYLRKVADLSQLTTEFFRPQSSLLSQLEGDIDNGELIHKATRDLWSFRKDGESWVIERLFDEEGDPLKV